MWNGTEKIYFIGICGISMSALAQVLHFQGHDVWGSDLNPGEIGISLNRLGINVFNNHSPDNILDADIVVYSSAIHDNNPELIYAKSKGLKIFSRAEVLGELSKHYKYTVAVAGSHGKTTTTGMLGNIFINAGLDPTVHIGGNFQKIAGNVRVGRSKFFITEACEYCDSYLKLSPHLGIILAVQADHLDYFKSVANVFESFSKFALKIKKYGCLIFNLDDSRALSISRIAKCKNIISLSKQKNADYYANSISCNSLGCFSFNVIEHGCILGKVELSVPGEHNIYNALAAIAVARFYGIDFSSISNSLSEFYGVDRRFELVGEINNARVYHDYAHHPTEISAVIKTARLLCSGRVFVVFQPHTFSRTKSFFKRFVKSLAGADCVIMYPIYPAREKPIPGITSDILSEQILNRNTPAICIHSFAEIKMYLCDKVRQNDIVLILGAGDIVGITKLF